MNSIMHHWKKVNNWLAFFSKSQKKRLDEDKPSDIGINKDWLSEKLAQLNKGVAGEEKAIEAQSYLAVLGFPIGSFGPNRNGIDGDFGGISKGAWRAFQKLMGLPVGDEIESQTLTALKETVVKGLTYTDLAQKAYQNGVEFEIRGADKSDFVNAVIFYAYLDQDSASIPPAVTVAQAILESNYGKSVPVDLVTGKYSYNLFGIKGTGPAGSVRSRTHEENPSSRAWEPTVALFRAYHSFHESIKDHNDFFYANSRYASALKTKDAEEFARRIAAAGYATDSFYADKLIYLMNYWGLNREA